MTDTIIKEPCKGKPVIPRIPSKDGPWKSLHRWPTDAMHYFFGPSAEWKDADRSTLVAIKQAFDYGYRLVYMDNGCKIAPFKEVEIRCRHGLLYPYGDEAQTWVAICCGGYWHNRLCEIIGSEKGSDKHDECIERFPSKHLHDVAALFRAYKRSSRWKKLPKQLHDQHS